MGAQLGECGGGTPLLGVDYERKALEMDIALHGAQLGNLEWA